MLPALSAYVLDRLRVVIISITQYHNINRGFVDLAISWRPDIGGCHARTHTGQHAVLLTMQNNDNYLKDGHLMLPETPE